MASVAICKGTLSLIALGSSAAMLAWAGGLTPALAPGTDEDPPPPPHAAASTATNDVPTSPKPARLRDGRLLFSMVGDPR